MNAKGAFRINFSIMARASKTYTELKYELIFERPLKRIESGFLFLVTLQVTTSPKAIASQAF